MAGTIAWHALPGEAVLDTLYTTAQGLSTQQAAARLERHGANALPAARGEPLWRRLLRQFIDPLILFLLAAAVMSLVLRHYVDAGVIVAVVLVNATVGFVQEGRAEQAMSGLRSLLAVNARVLRDGARQSRPVEELVPGDVILLDVGDRVTAYARLLRERGLRVDESILTGELVPVSKSVQVVA